MSNVTETMTLWAELGKLEEHLRSERIRLSGLEQELTASTRRLEAARQPLGDYYEQVGAGEREPDPELEAELLAAVQGAGAHVRLMVANDVRGGGVAEIVPVDERAERLVQGARRALANAERAVESYLRVEREGLAAELVADAERAKAAVDAALPALRAAVDADRHVRARWRRLLRANRLDDNLPPAPLRGWDDELATLGGRVPLAVPASLAAATADENDPATPETR